MAFQYRRLSPGHIRLLEVWPFSPNSPASNGGRQGLRYLVNDYAAPDAPPYIAISYRWGDGLPDHDIYLDGQKFPIRKNLWWCLYYARKHEGWRYFWVDAVCINQADISERNCQVQLMDKIYANASCVMVWLGLNKDSDGSYEPLADLVEGAAGFDRGVSGGVMEVAKNLYWSRMWVVQEFMLAKEILIFCGGYYVTWERFQDVLSLSARSELENSHLALANISPFIMSRYKHRYERRLSLFDLLKRYRHSECTDSRDRIFSMLSLLEPEERKTLNNQSFPDYSLTMDEVLIITVAHLYQQTPSDYEEILNIFSVNGLRRKAILDGAMWRFSNEKKDHCKSSAGEEAALTAKPQGSDSERANHKVSRLLSWSYIWPPLAMRSRIPSEIHSNHTLRNEVHNANECTGGSSYYSTTESRNHRDLAFEVEDSDDAEDHLYQLARSETICESLDFDLKWPLEIINVSPEISLPVEARIIFNYFRIYYHIRRFTRLALSRFAHPFRTFSRLSWLSRRALSKFIQLFRKLVRNGVYPKLLRFASWRGRVPFAVLFGGLHIAYYLLLFSIVF